MSLDTEYEEYFGDSGGDAYDRLKVSYDKLNLDYGDLVLENKELRSRYTFVHGALMARIEDEKSRCEYMVDKNTKKSNDLSMELTGLKQTKIRDLGLREE